MVTLLMRCVFILELMMENIKTYEELSKLTSFIDRFKYLKLSGKVGEDTFGYSRYLNQAFYGNSAEWQRVRNEAIIRDLGCDLGIEGLDIRGPIFVHHINPITKKDIYQRSEKLLDLNNLICCSFKTHNAIHYGDASLLIDEPVSRAPNDTCPWRQ